MSVNLYMFHGGSSFGFMSGALDEPSYKALVPSYGRFLCVMCPITNKLVVFLIQFTQISLERGTAMPEPMNMLPTEQH